LDHGSSAALSASAGGGRGHGRPPWRRGSPGRLIASWAHHFLTALAQHDPQVFVVIDLPTSLLLLFPADHDLQWASPAATCRRRT
jgi:hypothetical protein